MHVLVLIQGVLLGQKESLPWVITTVKVKNIMCNFHADADAMGKMRTRVAQNHFC